LISHVQKVSQKIYKPSSNISIDEIMVRFHGRSLHTFRMPKKPIDSGYKVIAACDRGFTISFLPVSRTASNENAVKKIDGLNETSCLVVHLVEQLPKTQGFNIYMDNFFSNIPLFKYLRSKGFGACGTARTNSAQFPEELKLGEGKEKLNWDLKLGVVVEDVLAFLWVDNKAVTMLTTIHNLGNKELGVGWQIERKRRRPRINSGNKSRIQATWGDEHEKIVAIPKVRIERIE